MGLRSGEYFGRLLCSRAASILSTSADPRVAAGNEQLGPWPSDAEAAFSAPLPP